MTSDPPEPKKALAHDGECRRCGTCCRKGGPTLHIQDRCLVEEGIIPLKNLVTFRRGEPVYDQIQGKVISLDAEIIKVKGREREWTCVLFDPVEKACTIYEYRPIECRMLKCWDTADLKRIYDKDRLGRKDLLASTAGLADLIDFHEQCCGYRVFARLAQALARNRQAPMVGDVGRMIRLDEDIRRMTTEKGGLNPRINAFLFGRPLADALKKMGLKAG